MRRTFRRFFNWAKAATGGQAALAEIERPADAADAMSEAKARNRALELLEDPNLFSLLSGTPSPPDEHTGRIWLDVPPFRMNRGGVAVSPEFVAASEAVGGLIRIGIDMELEGREVAMDPVSGRIFEISVDELQGAVHRRAFCSIFHYIVFLSKVMT